MTFSRAFFNDLESNFAALMESAEIEVPMPGATVLDYFETQNMAWTVGDPRLSPSPLETKGRLPRCYVWVETFDAEVDALMAKMRINTDLRLAFYTAVNTNMASCYQAARALAMSAASLLDQISMGRWDDVPPNPTPLLDNWRAQCNAGRPDISHDEPLVTSWGGGFIGHVVVRAQMRYADS